MANRNNVHVVQRGDQWGTLREGGQRASHVFDTQLQAIQVGRQMARHGLGELLIHGQDGRIRARDTYGNDPLPAEGCQVIKISVKGSTANEVLKAAATAIAKDLASKARAAAFCHGGVTVRFKRSTSGEPASMELQGSDAAIAAAQAALQR